MKTITTTKLKNEIKELIEQKEKILNEIKDSDNPQTKMMYLYHGHQIEALQAVIDRIEGDRIALTLI